MITSVSEDKPFLQQLKEKSKIGGTLLALVLIFSSVFFFSYQAQQQKDLRGKAEERQTINMPWRSSADLLTANEVEQPQNILQLEFTYNRQSPEDLTVSSARIINGYLHYNLPPQDTSHTISHLLTVTDNRNNVLSSRTFTVPDEVHYESSFNPPIGGHQELDTVTFNVEVPYTATMSIAKVIGADGSTIVSKSLDEIPQVNVQPDFHMIKGEEVYRVMKDNGSVQGISTGEKPSEKNDAVVTAIQYPQNLDSGTDPDGNLDILFLSSGYSQNEINNYHQDVNRLMTELLTLEPYKSRRAQIRFDYIDTYDNLGCTRQTGNWRCDLSLSALASGSAPRNELYVVINGIEYGGGASPYAHFEWGANVQGDPRVLSHELTHGFTNIEVHDEYGPFDPPPVTPTPPGGETQGNCYYGTIPNPTWTLIVPTNSYYRTCTDSASYRTSDESIMRTLSANYFNSITQNLIINSFNTLIGPSSDTINPSVNITYPPSNGPALMGTINLTVNATDNVGVIRVEYWKGNQIMAVTTQSPFSVAWDTRTVANGTYSLQAKAYDAHLNIGVHSITVAVNNPAYLSPTPSPTIYPTPNLVSQNIEVSNMYSNPDTTILRSITWNSPPTNLNNINFQMSYPNSIYRRTIQCIRNTSNIGMIIYYTDPNNRNRTHTVNAQAGENVICDGNPTWIRISSSDPIVGITGTPPPSQPPPAPTAVIPTPTTFFCPGGMYFTDVPAGHTYYRPAMCMSRACYDIMQDNVFVTPAANPQPFTFNPNQAVTRGWFAVYIDRIINIIVEGRMTFPYYPNQVFADVSGSVNNRFFTNVQDLSHRGLITGYGCGGAGEPCDSQNRPYYRPNVNLSRGQFSKLVTIAANYTEVIPTTRQSFTDVPVNTTYWEAIERLKGRGIIGGYACGGSGEPCDSQNRPYFRVNSFITKGQASKMMTDMFYSSCHYQ